LHGRDGYSSWPAPAYAAIAPRLFGDTGLHDVPLPQTDTNRGVRTYVGRLRTRMLEDDADAPRRAKTASVPSSVQAAYRSNATGQTSVSAQID